MDEASRLHLDLFSGIGGFAIAAQRCGYTTIGFCEKEPYAQQILKERFGAVLADASLHGCQERETSSEGQQHGGRWNARSQSESFSGIPRLHPNIFTLNGADYAGVDLLTGGFPCQPFSVAGKRRGAADDRALWPEMLRVIDGAKPAWIIGENVAGIVTMELDNILSDLEAIGYTAWPLVIPACAVDARHRRDRVWIVAHANNVRHKPVLRETLSGGQDQTITHPESGCGSERGSSLLGQVQAGQGKDVAHADEPSRQGNERTERSQPERADHQQHRGRQSQPSIRRVADGLPEGMDGRGEYCEWPEEDLQTPRVSTGIKHRAHRLRGLGNAIVPQVAETLIRMMARTTNPE